MGWQESRSAGTSKSEGRLQLGLWASVVLLALSPALENDEGVDEGPLKCK